MEWLFFLFVFVLIAGALSGLAKPNHCSICSQTFKRVYHTWKTKDSVQYLCPNCNSQRERQVSKAAFKRTR